MITDIDLRRAIAECQGARDPNANTCIKLASYYTILDHMSQEEPQMEHLRGESFSAAPYDSGTEFSNAIRGRNLVDIMPVLDELMTTLQVVNPRLYASVMARL